MEQEKKTVSIHLTYLQTLKNGVLAYDSEGVKRIATEALDAHVPLTRLLDDDLLLKANGFEAMSPGRDVKAAAFVEWASGRGAHVLAFFSLMSTSRSYQSEIIEELECASFQEQIKLLVSGGSCHLEWAQPIGADGYGPDAVEAVRAATRLPEIWA